MHSKKPFQKPNNYSTLSVEDRQKFITAKIKIAESTVRMDELGELLPRPQSYYDNRLYGTISVTKLFCFCDINGIYSSCRDILCKSDFLLNRGIKK